MTHTTPGPPVKRSPPSLGLTLREIFVTSSRISAITIEKLVFGFEEEVTVPDKYCRAGAPEESCYALAVHSRPAGAWNQQRLSRVASMTTFNMAAEG